jgi:hypothetical protein
MHEHVLECMNERVCMNVHACMCTCVSTWCRYERTPYCWQLTPAWACSVYSDPQISGQEVILPFCLHTHTPTCTHTQQNTQCLTGVEYSKDLKEDIAKHGSISVAHCLPCTQNVFPLSISFCFYVSLSPSDQSVNYIFCLYFLSISISLMPIYLSLCLPHSSPAA